MIETITKPWKQACDLFSKKELLVFVFSWIRTFKRAALVFLKYFWWLLTAEILLKMNLSTNGLSSFGLSSLQNYRTYIMISIGIISMFSIFFSVLSIRASIEVKNLFYFLGKFKKVFGFALLYGGIITLLTLFISWNTGISPINWALSTNLRGTNMLMQAFAALFLLIATMLVVDNQATINGLKIIQNTCKSIVNFLPAIAALTILYLVSYFCIGSLMTLIHPSIGIISISLLNFFFTCAVAVLYLRMKHKNHALFFGN